jgi:tetratricopeptide (TPR) repeat protein
MVVVKFNRRYIAGDIMNAIDEILSALGPSAVIVTAKHGQPILDHSLPRWLENVAGDLYNQNNWSAVRALAAAFASPSPFVRLVSARAAHQLKQFTVAEDELRSLTFIDTVAGEAHFGLGLLFDDYRNPNRSNDAATRSFRDAADAEYPREDVFVRLASRESASRALGVLRKGLTQYPDSLELHEALASHLLTTGELNGVVALEKEVASRGITSDKLKFSLAVALSRLLRATEAIAAFDSIQDVPDVQLPVLLFAKSVAALNGENTSTAEKWAREAVALDVSNSLQWLGHLAIAKALLLQARRGEGMKILAEIPHTQNFDPPGLLTNWGGFWCHEFIRETVIEFAELRSAHARALRAVNRYYDAKEEKGRLRLAKRDLLASGRVVAQTFEHQDQLIAVLAGLDEYEEAFKIAVRLQGASPEVRYNEHYFGEKWPSTADEATKCVASFESEVKKLDGDQRDRVGRAFLPEIIPALHKLALYQQVVDSLGFFHQRTLEELDCQFEIAYAYAEVGAKTTARKFYERLIKSDGRHYSAINNLAVIEEEEGNVIRAHELFAKALASSPGSELYQRNEKRTRAKVEELDQRNTQRGLASARFVMEDPKTRALMARLYRTRFPNGDVTIVMNTLASELGLAASGLKTKLLEWQARVYISKVVDEQRDGSTVCIAFDSVVVPHLESEIYRADHEVWVQAVSANLVQLEETTGLEQLANRLATAVRNPDLGLSLRRDLREAAVAQATESYKSTLVLCGGIVEALLVDHISRRRNNGVKALAVLRKRHGEGKRSGDDHVDKWTLSTLIDVAFELKLIGQQVYHWSHGLRGYRNLVHPSVELRGEVTVSKESAIVAWQVVRLLIQELC